ncbi:helitron_like_N domain-containing protein [Caerostris extrusa]|uniref:Helitron_like_N domain-containing protein n=1 Tax=Caerostris extrusa TaxID=172846 RepID=A0AAV4PIH8_CAEEX|nr:helitron_like_N domain-containing protein [Caerostris extrusa]
MPARRKAANLGFRTKKSASMQNIKAHRRDEQIQQDNADVLVSMARFRESQSQEARDERNRRRKLEQRQARRYYEPHVEYYAHSKVDIGTMGKESPHCHALKFKNEAAGLCCASGKVQLPQIKTPPEPLHGLLISTNPDSIM